MAPVQAPPPASAAGPDAPAFSDDPREPGYDPAKLVLIGRDPGEIWNGELVTQPWARERATFLQDQIRGTLASVAPGVEVAVECRTSACRVMTTFSSYEDYDRHFEYGSFPLHGELQANAPETDLHEDGKFTNAYYVFFTPEQRNPLSYARWYEAQRQRQYDRWRREGARVPE